MSTKTKQVSADNMDNLSRMSNESKPQTAVQIYVELPPDLPAILF